MAFCQSALPLHVIIVGNLDKQDSASTAEHHQQAGSWVHNSLTLPSSAPGLGRGLVPGTAPFSSPALTALFTMLSNEGACV